MTHIQFDLMQGWQDYVLWGSLALLVVAVIAKAISTSSRREATPQPQLEPNAETAFSIGTYRNRALTPNY